ncbi:SDR family NAD(P)-dependent oxidoreductase [Streptomyces odonnellii]|uniref:SDR family NAD(P)-dependent oxidoreductase n=1 Tax=Streptomyces odonnellii TaxID=1417980 RepID=UPI0006257B2B|nr:SDR family oxidoreductase [Streptomyces odonnellii]
MSRSLADRRIVVTGAGAGIGRAIARKAASHGASVLCIDLDADGLEETARLIQAEASAVEVAAEALDCTDHDAAVEVLERRAAVWGGAFDALVNNAGVTLSKPLAECDLADLERIFRVNVGGMLVMSRALLPRLTDQGVIVNVNSSSARHVHPGLGLYGASKAANAYLTQVYAAEFAERGIRVCGIGPGAVDTNMPRSMMPPGAEGERMLQEAVSGTQLIKRLARPEEIAEAICFLLSEDAAYITGSTLWIDGGASAVH